MIKPVEAKYEYVTRVELVTFQRDARNQGNKVGESVAAEAVRLMGLYRFWKQRAERAEALLRAECKIHHSSDGPHGIKYEPSPCQMAERYSGRVTDSAEGSA